MNKIKIWLIDLYDKRRIKNKWLWGILFFYVPLILLLIPTIIPIINDIRFEHIHIYVCEIIASVWIVFGVVLTNIYFDNLSQFAVVKNDNKLSKIDNIDLAFGGIMKKYKKLQITFTIIWCSSVVVALIITKESLIEFLSLDSLIAYILLLLYVAFTAYIQAFGYSCLVMTIWILARYYDKFVDINNLEETIEKTSNFIFNTLISFLSGMMFFPLMFVFANGGNRFVKLVVSGVAFFYILFLLLYILFCCYYVKQKSEKIKSKYIKKFKKDNDEIRKELLYKFDEVNNYNDEQRGKIIDTIFNSAMINDIKNIESNPFTKNKIYITVFVLIIPLVKTFIDFKEKFIIYLNWLGL